MPDPTIRPTKPRSQLLMLITIYEFDLLRLESALQKPHLTVRRRSCLEHRIRKKRRKSTLLTQEAIALLAAEAGA
jgi:hypothetical protein